MGVWDTWRARKASGRGLTARHSGHVAHSEGFRRVALGVGFGDTWHSPKVSPKKVPKGLSVGALGHKAYSEGKFEGGAFGVTFGTRGTLRRVPKKVSKGLSG